MAKARKCIVAGSRSVGKSSMTVRFVEDHFVELYYPTIENQFHKNMRYKDEDFNIEILDTAGQDEFSIINEKHLIGVHGYLLVYLVTSRQSFELMEVIREKILDSSGSNEIVMVLVGNKCDLAYQRQVTLGEGKALAGKFGCRFMETSVRDNVNVDTAFEALLEQMEKHHNPVEEKPNKCVIV